MAIAQPASSQAGTQQVSNNQPEGQPENLNVPAGAAPEKAAPGDAVPVEATAVAGAVSGEANATGGANESPAAQLSGYSSEDVKIIDANFHKLLETVHQNRPGDDLAHPQGMGVLPAAA